MLVVSLLLLQCLLSLWAKEKRKRTRRRDGDGPPGFDPDVGDGYSLFDNETGVTFVPPMRYQRIAAVRTLLKDPRWDGEIKKMSDLGCGQFAFATVLKDLPAVEEYCAMDYLESQLRDKLLTLSLLAGQLRSLRTKRTVLRVLAGSLADPDDRLVGSDAVICIEVIEHLNPDVLESVPHVVFGCIKPKVAIFTTPNFEFNFLFGDVSQLRDTDHRFEWTREQFKCWARNVASRYPEYDVEFYGVGRGPPGTTHVGCCTQLALFHRRHGGVTTVKDGAVRHGEPYVHVHDFVVEPLPVIKYEIQETRLLRQLHNYRYMENLQAGGVGSSSDKERDRVGGDNSTQEEPGGGQDPDGELVLVKRRIDDSYLEYLYEIVQKVPGSNRDDNDDDGSRWQTVEEEPGGGQDSDEEYALFKRSTDDSDGEYLWDVGRKVPESNRDDNVDDGSRWQTVEEEPDDEKWE